MIAGQLLERLADAEARIAKIYERFATEFRAVADIGDLWESMGREELRHANHLTLAAASAPRDRLVGAEMAEHLAALEALITGCERQLARPVPLQEALAVTVDLEDGEQRHLHAALPALGTWTRALLDDPLMQHRQHHLLEHAVGLFGTATLQARLGTPRKAR